MGKIVLGCMWIGAALCGMFDNVVMLFLNCVFLISALIILFYMRSKDLEEDDEMSAENAAKAKSKTLDVFHMIFAVGSLMLIVLSRFYNQIDVNWIELIANLLYLFIGLQNLLVGIFFRKLEAE